MLVVDGDEVPGEKAVGLQPSTAEVWSDRTGTWAATGQMVRTRAGQQAVVLGDGDVLVDGGVVQDGAPSERFRDGACREAGPLVDARSAHSNTLLADGQVLAAGGVGVDKRCACAPYLTSSEVYDPATDLWTQGPAPATRARPLVTPLQDGRVLVAGGYVGARSAELLVPTPAKANAPTAPRPSATTADLVGSQDRTRVHDGQALTVRGVLTRAGEGGPLASEPVVLYSRSSDGGAWTVEGSARTDAAGTASFVLTPQGSRRLALRHPRTDTASQAAARDAAVSVVNTPPAAPENGRVSAGDQEVQVSWSPPADDGGSPVTGYPITGYPITYSDTSVDVGPEVRSAKPEGAVNGRSYQVTVQPRNAVDLAPTGVGRVPGCRSGRRPRRGAAERRAPRGRPQSPRTPCGPDRLRRGGAVTLTGEAGPAQPGAGVLLQRWIGTSWKTIAALRLDSRSRARATQRPGVGTSRYRLWQQPDSRHDGGVSATVVLTVER